MIAFFGRCRRFLDTSLSWGAVAYSYAQPALSKSFLSQGGGKLIFSDVIGAPYWAAALVFALILIGQLMALEKWRPWRAELGDDVDGDPPSRPAGADADHAGGIGEIANAPR